MLKKRILQFLCFVTVTALFFQNCSQGFDGDGGAEAESIRTPSNLDFTQGQAYDSTLLPYPLESDSLTTAQAYSEMVGFKAMAFTQRGELYVANSSDSLISSQEEWERVTLERCQLVSMNQSCSLFASGDFVFQDGDDFLRNFVKPIVVPSSFDGNLLPGVIDHWRVAAATAYPDFSLTQFKGFAIGPNGSGFSGWSQVSQAEASRRALEYCEASDNHTCTIYAEGLTPVLNLANYSWGNQKVFYAPRGFNIDEIPFITDVVREEIRAEYDLSVSNGEYFALAMEQFGGRESLVSATPITQTELDTLVSDCTANIPAPANPGDPQRSCFLYSVDADLVMTRQSYLDSLP